MGILFWIFYRYDFYKQRQIIHNILCMYLTSKLGTQKFLEDSKHEQGRCNPLFEYHWMSFLEEASPSETLEAALVTRGRKKKQEKGTFSFLKSGTFISGFKVCLMILLKISITIKVIIWGDGWRQRVGKLQFANYILSLCNLVKFSSLKKFWQGLDIVQLQREWKEHPRNRYILYSRVLPNSLIRRLPRSQ